MNPVSTRPPALYAAFILLALFAGVILGSLSGAIFANQLRLGSGVVLPFQKEAHARLQLFGFTLTLIMGIASHALPRFLGVELHATARMKATLAAMAVAIAGWTTSLLLRQPDKVALAQIVAATGALLATGLFTHVLLELIKRAESQELYPVFIMVGAVGWLLAAILNLAEALMPSIGSDAVYAAALLGGVLPWTFGMSLRTAFTFMGLGQPNQRLIRASLGTLTGGAALAVAGLLMPAPRIESFGLLMVGFASVALVVGAKVFKRSAVQIASEGFPFAIWMRVAHGFLMLFVALSALWATMCLATGLPERGYLMDGSRHALATGYLLLLITGMMGKVLPLFSGRALRARAAFILGGFLLAAGTLAREAQLVAYFLPDEIFVRLAAHSGACTLAGLVLSTGSILATLGSRPPARPSAAFMA